MLNLVRIFYYIIVQIKEMSWLPLPLPPQCKMIISSSKADFSYKSLTCRPDTTVHVVPSLTNPEYRAQVTIIFEILNLMKYNIENIKNMKFCHEWCNMYFCYIGYP